MGVEVAGLFSLILLALSVWAIIKIVGSRASTLAKVLWILAILIFPLIGLIAWFFAGPR